MKKYFLHNGAEQQGPFDIEDLKTKKNYVIVPDIETYKINEGVVVCNLKDFIHNHLSKIK